MHFIPDDIVVKWETKQQVKLPVSVDLACPRCGRKVNFGLAWGALNFGAGAMSTASRCQACSYPATFILVDIHDVAEGEKRGNLYVYPKPKVRHPLKGVENIKEFSDALYRAYTAALASYNAGIWPGAAVLSGRLLEGIAAETLPKDKQKLSLYEQIRILPEYKNLDEPIVTIADAVRKLRNLGAHFDLEREPDEETTTLMIELLDYLIEYLFVLPQRIEQLNDAIDNL